MSSNDRFLYRRFVLWRLFDVSNPECAIMEEGEELNFLLVSGWPIRKSMMYYMTNLRAKNSV